MLGRGLLSLLVVLAVVLLPVVNSGRHQIFVCYKSREPAAGAPVTAHPFARTNFSNAVFSPPIGLQHMSPAVCGAEFDPSLDNGTCLPDPSVIADGSAELPDGSRAL